MSSGIFTPSNQVRLTNVSVVRLKRAGHRFELACYKNKLIDYRNRVTRDLDQVLQTHAVFINVSKGQLAPKDDLLSAFGHADIDKIILEILDKGELQVSGKERDVQLESLHKEVATIISEKCVNPNTRTPYPPALIEKALAGLRFSPNPKKTAKQQALECIRELASSKNFPIARARMRLIVDLPNSSHLRDLRPLFSQIEQEQVSESVRLTVLIEPINYRKIMDIVAKQTKGVGSVHIESLKEMKEQDNNYL